MQAKFVQTVLNVINGHVDNKHWELIKLYDVPKNVEIVLSVWTMHHKHNSMTNEVTKKYKARLNTDRSSKHMVSTTLKPMHLW